MLLLDRLHLLVCEHKLFLLMLYSFELFGVWLIITFCVQVLGVISNKAKVLEVHRVV